MLTMQRKRQARADAQDLYRLLLSRLGEDFFAEHHELRVAVTDMGRTVLIVDELHFTIDPDIDEPIVGRRTDDGTELGWVSPRGLRWGYVPVMRPPSMN